MTTMASVQLRDIGVGAAARALGNILSCSNAIRTGRGIYWVLGVGHGHSVTTTLH